MDILFVRNLFRPADFGGNRYPWEVTRRLSERGHRVRVVTPRPGGPLPGPTPVELHHYPCSRRTPLETFGTNALLSQLAVRRQIVRRRPDVIVFSSYDVAYGQYAWGRLAPRVPSVYIYHSSFYSDAVDRVAKKPWPISLAHGPLDSFTRHVETTVFRSATRIVAVSPFSRREIEARLGGPTPRLQIIPTGIDTELFAPGDRLAARQELGIPDDARILLTVGRLSKVKRYDRAIDAFKLLYAEDSTYMLIIAGLGPVEAELRAQAGSHPGIRFAGFVDGTLLRDHYRAADVVLCTSEFENWSLAILEALSTGSVVLGTPRGSIPDLLGLVDSALVFDGVEPEAIANGVRALLRDAERVEQLRQRARSEISARFSWDRTVSQLEECFTAAIAEGAGSP